MSCGYHASQAALAPKGYLTGAEWDWATPYRQLVTSAQAGTPQPNVLRGGLKEGFVKMSPYGAKVSAAAKQNADSIKTSMVAGNFVIFKGPMQGQQGRHSDRVGREPRADRLHAREHELSGDGRRRPDLILATAFVEQ